MKELWKYLLGAACALLLSALIRLVSQQPNAQPVFLEALPSPRPLTVHVSGAVIKPGVYELRSKSRVWDAIQAAGGFRKDADQDAQNLAAFLKDADKIEVPVKTTVTQAVKVAPTLEVVFTTTPTAGTPTATPYPRVNFPININTASALELEQLPEIGQIRAARITGYRERNGPFKRIEDIRYVYSITAEVFTAIRDLITVGDPAWTATPVR